MLNGHLIKDTAAIIQACVLHGNTAILSLVIDKYTTINRDWFYYALSQLTENVFMATRAHVMARWIINYAAEHAYTMPTHDLLELINLADKTTAYAALDAIYDNSAHYKIFINHLTLSTKCQLSPNAELYLYDNGKRKYTVAEYAAATLRSVMSSLVCK
ncbi:hypothetical protein D5b_00064 [Faustovirus]|nr:hypothetical protein D5b_00064 [Faustovirus]AMN84846.1 hypothetical protein D6_00446 [Faustovirus]AMP44022.1 hypothetical protein PRJ_Dakar_00063 [Faustovirus]